MKRDLPSNAFLHTTQRRPKSGAGFTLIEIIIAMGITLALLAFFMANYGRSNKDSLLSRETNLVMANMRYAQELTSTGKTVKRCNYFSGLTCSTDADCDFLTGGTSGQKDFCLSDEKSPPGGYATVFSCPPIWSNGSSAYPSPIGNPESTTNKYEMYPISYYGKRAYSIFADTIACKKFISPSTGEAYRCFPPLTMAIDPEQAWQGDYVSDGIISSMQFQKGTGLRGDTLKERFFLNNDVEIRDIRITSLLGTTSQCDSTSPYENSKWHGAPSGSCNPPPADRQVPNTNSTSSSGSSVVLCQGYQPIQAVIRFLPPDGRRVQINDNVTSSPPTATWQIDPNNPWAKAEIMLGIVKRNKDCRVITADQSGAISQRVDADCSFTTAN